MVRAFTKLAAVAAAVFALFCGSQAAHAAGKTDLSGTYWATPVKGGGTLVLAISPDGDEFALVVFDSEGEQVKKITGNCTMRGDVLKLTDGSGRQFDRLEIVSVSRTTLVTITADGTEVTWKRFTPKKQRRDDGD
jgi:hypothetical protein